MTASRPAESQMVRPGQQSWGTKVALGAILGIVVAAGLALFGDVRQLASALRGFAWWLAAPILVLTLANYALRFVKWELYLRRLAVPSLPGVTSALVFLSGFSMSLTPGKVGELIKCVFLRRLTGTPMNRTSAVVAVERLTDGLAMLALAGLGLTQFAYGRALLGGAALGGLVLLALLRRPHLLASTLARVEHWPLIGPRVEHAIAFVHASAELLGARLLAGAVGLGIVSWAWECAAFFLVLVGLGLDPTWDLLVVAIFVLAVSSIVGALSMLPGGLGVADASVAGMLLLLVPDDAMTRGTAVAATLLIRFATLWFGLIIGVIALVVLERRIATGIEPTPTVSPGATVSEPA